MPRRIAVIASASGNGKTTLSRELARRLDVPFGELDALVHGPGWLETPDAVLRAQVEPIVAAGGWVIDGTYQRKLGDLVLDSAELVVWLDLPLRVWLSRLVRRTWRRVRTKEPLWNGNTESVASALWGCRRRLKCMRTAKTNSESHWPRALARYPVVRLRTPDEVARFLAEAPDDALNSPGTVQGALLGEKVSSGDT